jgi:predicted Co/Zn/Cd cation transporter (cation efflux family)
MRGDGRRTVIDASIFFLVILLMTQMWLLTATLESYLAGHRDVALPGVVISAILVAGCAAIYLFIARLEKRG